MLIYKTTRILSFLICIINFYLLFYFYLLLQIMFFRKPKLMGKKEHMQCPKGKVGTNCVLSVFLCWVCSLLADIPQSRNIIRPELTAFLSLSSFEIEPWFAVGVTRQTMTGLSSIFFKFDRESTVLPKLTLADALNRTAKSAQ